MKIVHPRTAAFAVILVALIAAPASGAVNETYTYTAGTHEVHDLDLEENGRLNFNKNNAAVRSGDYEFFVHHGSGDVPNAATIHRWNRATGAVDQSFQIGTCGDDHTTPAVTVDAAGIVHAVVCGHVTNSAPRLHAKGAMPNSLAGMTVSTFATPAQEGGDQGAYNFLAPYNGGVAWVGRLRGANHATSEIAMRTYSGGSWSAFNTITLGDSTAFNPYPYDLYANGSTLVLAYGYRQSNTGPWGAPYLAFTSNGGSTWTDHSGSTLPNDWRDTDATPVTFRDDATVTVDARILTGTDGRYGIVYSDSDGINVWRQTATGSNNLAMPGTPVLADGLPFAETTNAGFQFVYLKNDAVRIVKGTTPSDSGTWTDEVAFRVAANDADARSVKAAFPRGPSAGPLSDSFYAYVTCSTEPCPYEMVRAATASANTNNAAPVSCFTYAVDSLTATFDGGCSTDSDGTITSYAWDMGDGATKSGATSTHTYAAAGTYTVTLSVTDDAGAIHAIATTVSVAPNATGGGGTNAGSGNGQVVDAGSWQQWVAYSLVALSAVIAALLLRQAVVHEAERKTLAIAGAAFAIATILAGYNADILIAVLGGPA